MSNIGYREGEDSLRKKNNVVAYFFLFPALIMFVLFFIYPNLEVIYLSLFKWAGISPKKTFIGFYNFQVLFSDLDFLKAVFNTLMIAFQSMVVQVPMALILAILLNKKMKGNGTFSTIVFLPMVISLVAVGIIWRWLYDPEYGAINLILGKIGLQGLQHAWLGDVNTAFLSVLATINWVYIGFYTVIFMSALKGISPEIFEAAKVDGFNEFQTTLRIRIPMLKETIGVMFIMCISGSFKSFDLIWVMTGGGPVNSTEIVTTYLYRMAFRRMESGYASAISVTIFLICLVLIALQLKLMKITAQE